MLYLELISKVFNSMKLNDRLETFYYRLLKRILSNSMRNMSLNTESYMVSKPLLFLIKTMQLSMPLFFFCDRTQDWFKIRFNDPSILKSYNFKMIISMKNKQTCRGESGYSPSRYFIIQKMQCGNLWRILEIKMRDWRSRSSAFMRPVIRVSPQTDM